MRRRALAVVLGAFALAVLPAGSALAHPLGNFTVNSADRIVLTGEGVRLTHVLDIAEIPTVQLRAEADTNGDGQLEEPELTTLAERRCAEVEPQLELEVDGAPAVLTLQSSTGEPRPGAAGLKITRLECVFTAPGRATSSVFFNDPTGQNRVGWKEISATSVCGRITSSDVPATSPSQLLTAYPADLLSSPLEVFSAQLSVQAGGPCSATGAERERLVTSALPRGVDRLTTAYTDFVGRQDLTVGIALLAIALSVVLGSAHALAPGHGKTVIAAYLVGQRGTKKQAVWLGATVTLTHTAGVLLLGALLTITTVAAPERIVPATQILSGLLLAGIGIGLLYGAVRRLRSSPDHDHGAMSLLSGSSELVQAAAQVRNAGEPAGSGSVATVTAPARPHEHPHPHEHDHPHEHEHDHPHPHAAEPAPADHDAAGVDPAAGHSHGGRFHTHAPLPDRPLGWRSLAAMGIAGGLVPSPSALVVLLGATALGRAAFGAVLVFGYGLGMAITLTVAGLLLLRAQGLLARRGWMTGRGLRWAYLLPVVTAGLVVAVGVGLMVRGVVLGRGLF